MDEELQRKLNRQFLYSMNLSEEQNTKPIRKSSPGTSLKKGPISIIQTLDNPQVLEQQLEALEHHKKVLERREQYQKMLQDQGYSSTKPKVSSGSISVSTECGEHLKLSSNIESNYSNTIKAMAQSPNQSLNSALNSKYDQIIYSNLINENIPRDNSDLLRTERMPLNSDSHDPPSPVSSSYSELMRATLINPNYQELDKANKCPTYGGHTSYNKHEIYFNTQPDYAPCDLNSQSSNYESLYEPINPRPPSQMSNRSNYSIYTPYANVNRDADLGSLNSVNFDPNPHHHHQQQQNTKYKEAEVDVLTDQLVQSLDRTSEQTTQMRNNIKNNSDYEEYTDNFGVCVRCGERVIGEQSGCTAMDQIYHISCFSCSRCQINLQGKPFYALDGQPCCEDDYLNTLEKCSVCMKPILERILRATGKPYHPNCFCCVVCGKSLDGIPFTVDATNQNHCIEDFHKKFAPRCCVCKQPIMPEHGREETIRVVALDRSFHVHCYKCEDCGLLLSNGDEGHGCFPLDDHILCQSCNAVRVQALTSRMTTEL